MAPNSGLTHPYQQQLSRTVCQNSSLQNVKSDLEVALHRAFSIGNRPYKAATVVFINWSNDDMGVVQRQEELAEVFRDKLHYRTEFYTIKTEDEHMHFNIVQWLLNLAKVRGGKDSLIILMYSGYGQTVPDDSGRNEFIIGGDSNYMAYNFKGPPTSLSWHQAVSIVETHAGDVLHILDSDHSGYMVVNDGPEILAATSPVGQISFSSVLRDTLHSLNGSPVSASGLFARVCQQLHASGLEEMPVYVPNLRQKTSVILHSLAPDSITSLAQTPPKDVPKSGIRLLITVHVADSINPELMIQFKSWLSKEIPSICDSVKVEVQGSSSIGSSSLLLLTIPIEMWYYLPMGKKYTYLAIVRSGIVTDLN
ncbi:hypothetical protein B0J11DRAFT_606440 [Dendryphion nanum]|uniref:Uncharacterized protein n=1 Tax=Dendryphion nanum TaxID=256645 RepID=A0A9P9DQT7_9PLEO|nr:hypothetical protein B0J11DRAFT_606440 [Dendryphion nanum]